MFDVKTATIEELEARMNEIKKELDADDADLDALEKETRSIIEEKESRKAAEDKRRELREKVAAGAGAPVTGMIIPKDERKDENNMKEFRNSKAYIDAYAEYIKTNDDTEVRAIMTENATDGTVPVPDFVDGVVRTAWQRDGIMSRVRKSYLKGNIKVGFEISATGAVVHEEGSGPISEETLVLGTVSIVPETIKKWISISDEVMDLRGEEFLRYIYDELTYQIAKKAANELVDKVIAAPTESTETEVGLPAVTQNTLAIGNIAAAAGYLSDEAANPVIVMHKLTHSAYKALQYAANYPVDPFEGYEVVYDNHMKSFAEAAAGDTYVVMGDFDRGAIANFPNGDEPRFKYDDLTLATSDLVRVIGRLPVGLGVVGPDMFVRIRK